MDKALELLASKLGTTTEYLWRILLKQAPIEGAFDLSVIAITSVLLYGSYRYWCWYARARHQFSDDGEIGWSVLGGVVTFAAVILFFVMFFSLPLTYAAFFNPEYWALHQILHVVR